MDAPNTNYPWAIVEAYGEVKTSTILADGSNYVAHAEDTTIVDKDGHEVVGCSEWIRGDENFHRIVLCVNACAHLTNEQLEELLNQ